MLILLWIPWQKWGRLEVGILVDPTLSTVVRSLVMVGRENKEKRRRSTIRIKVQHDTCASLLLDIYVGVYVIACAIAKYNSLESIYLKFVSISGLRY